MHGRQMAERALLESDERYRAVIDSLEEGIVIHEADGTISSCNASACRILGLSERALLGRSARHPGWRAVREDGSPFEPESDPAAITLLTGQPCSQVVMGIEKPGRPRVWISINSRPLRRSPESDLYAVAVSFTDITRHKGTEEELRRRAFQQAAIADLGRHALEGTGIEVLLDEAVRRTAAVLQVEHCKIADKPGAGGLLLRASTGWMDLAGRPELAAPRHGRDGSVSMRGARLAGISVPIPGRERPWGMLSAHTRADRSFSPEDTDFLQAVANVLAVAVERQRDQEAVRGGQELIRKAATEWRLTFDTIDYPVLLLEMEGGVVRVNTAARDLAGLPFDELLQRPVASLGEGEPWTAIAELLPQVKATGEAASTQVRDEQERSWDVSLRPVTHLDYRGVVAVARDVTEQVKLQESLRRSETMSAMGGLVAGVAHEVRNPLFGISATLDAFASRFKRRTEYRRYLEVLQGEVDRLNELMQDLLDYGKPLRLVLAPERPDELMRQAIAACEPLATQAGVEIAANAAPGLPCLPVDRNRMVQVFLNLLENAIQHSPRGARVAFRADEASPGRAAGSGGIRGIRFHVEDDGPGFQTQDLPRLFEPFFTRRRGGTGLGLSIVQRIVEQHGGEIVPANRPAGGASVSVTLPLGPDPGEEPT